MLKMSDAYATALKLQTLGYSVIPSGGGDKGKSPLVSWREFETRIPTEAELAEWNTDKRLTRG